MKKTLIILAAGLIIGSCGEKAQDSSKSNYRELPPLSSREQVVVEGGQEFSLDLVKALAAADESGNIFISPLSVSLALGMTLNGAAGQTYEDMKNTMRLSGLSETEINQAYQSIMETLSGIDDDVIMEIANSIWIKEGFPVQEDFIAANSNYFEAEVTELNFDDPAAVDIINDWVSDNTSGKIQEIINEISELAVLYLINAIYYNAIWEFEFDKGLTASKPFYPGSGLDMNVDMMVQTATLPYYSDGQVQVIDLPYGRGNYTMTVFLPLSGTINEFIASLGEEGLANYLEHLSQTEVTLYLPKLKTSYEILMNDVLTELGMAIAFDSQGQADFSGINPEVLLFISRVIHKTFVQIDEAGTEAAAVTAVEVSLTSDGGVDPVYMNVNHPYFFLIREKETGAVLFTGRIDEPVWED